MKLYILDKELFEYQNILCSNEINLVWLLCPKLVLLNHVLNFSDK